MTKIIFEYEVEYNDRKHVYCLTDKDYVIHFINNNRIIGERITNKSTLVFLKDIQKMQERIRDLEEVIEVYEKDDINL